jgi:hypothetical protein
MGYFSTLKDKNDVLMLQDFTCGQTRMAAVPWTNLFTAYNPAWKKYVSQENEKVVICQPDILGRREWKSKNFQERDCASKRLKHEIGICEILEHEKMMSAGCRSLAEYKGLVVDEHSQQVEGVAYQGYSSNLIAYVQDGYLTWAGRRKIVDAVAEALRYLHHMGIAHGKVRAENVYLEYGVRVVLKGAVLGGFASAEFLGGKPEAECVSVMQQDWTDLRMLEQWMRGVLMAQPSV